MQRIPRIHDQATLKQQVTSGLSICNADTQWHSFVRMPSTRAECGHSTRAPNEPPAIRGHSPDAPSSGCGFGQNSVRRSRRQPDAACRTGASSGASVGMSLRRDLLSKGLVNIRTETLPSMTCAFNQAWLRRCSRHRRSWRTPCARAGGEGPGPEPCPWSRLRWHGDWTRPDLIVHDSSQQLYAGALSGAGNLTPLDQHELGNPRPGDLPDQSRVRLFRESGFRRRRGLRTHPRARTHGAEMRGNRIGQSPWALLGLWPSF
jgi:hypothetical protein